MSRRRVFLAAGVSLLIAFTSFSLYGLDSQSSDLAVTDVRFYVGTAQADPSDEPSIPKGARVRIIATIANLGAATSADVYVRFSWRRVDKETICGFGEQNLGHFETHEVRDDVEERFDTADLTPGKYLLIVEVDPDDLIKEPGKEMNNKLVRNFWIEAPKAELHPIRIMFDPSSPIEQGHTVEVEVEIENTGSSKAGQFLVSFEICEGELSSCLIAERNQWRTFGSVIVRGLERDDSIRLVQVLDTLGLQGQASYEGPHPIRVVVDVNQAVIEEDDNNNVIVASLTTKGSSRSLPELHPVDLVLAPPSPIAWGSDLNVAATIVNDGGEATSEGTVARFSWRSVRTAGEEQGEWQRIEPDTAIKKGLQIEKGENTLDISTTWFFDPSKSLPGSYELKLEVDPEKKIDELNENNNVLIIGFSVEGSELHPQSLDIGATPIRQGDSVIVTVEIINTGQRVANDFVVGFFVGDDRVDTFHYQGSGLGQGDVVEVQGTFSTSDLPYDPPCESDNAGCVHIKHMLRVVVDPDNRIPELDEDNNEIAMPLRIEPPERRLPELHPTEIVLYPPSPVPVGESVEVWATVRNTGNIDADRFRVKVALGYDECESNPTVKCADCQDGNQEGKTNVRYSCCQCADVKGLSRGAKIVIKQWFSTAELQEDETYWVWVAVDPGVSAGDSSGEVEEMDENNNDLIVYFTVGTPSDGGQPDKPNLTVRGLTVNPPLPAENTAVRLTAEITNTGGQAAGSFDTRFRIRGPAISYPSDITRTCVGLQPGESTSESVTVQLRRGTYNIEVVVDPDDRIEESSETDNQVTTSLSIGPGPQRADLVPLRIHFEPASPKEGENVQVYATVENQGRGVAGEVKGSFFILVDEYVPFAHAVDGALGSGNQTDLLGILDTKAMGLPAGTYKIQVLVDPDNKIIEEHETNNAFVEELEIVERGPAVSAVEGISGVIRYLASDEKTSTSYLASENGKLFRIPAGGVQASLAFDAANPITAFCLDDGSSRAAYLGTSIGELVVYSLDRGEETLHVALNDNSSVSAIAFDRFGNIYTGTSAKVVSVTGATGKVRWEYSLAKSEEVTALAVHNTRNRVYVATSFPSSGRLYAFALDQQNVDDPVDPEWKLDLSGSPSAMALDDALDGRIWVGTSKGEILAVTFGGRLDSARTYAAGGAITGIVLDLKQRDPLYATTDEGRLYGLTLSGEFRWVFPSEGSVGPIPNAAAVDDPTGDVIFGTNDGFLFAVDSMGNRLWIIGDLDDTGSEIVSSPAVTRVIERDGAMVFVFRVIYFGTLDGKVYLAKEAF